MRRSTRGYIGSRGWKREASLKEKPYDGWSRGDFPLDYML